MAWGKSLVWVATIIVKVLFSSTFYKLEQRNHECDRMYSRAQNFTDHKIWEKAEYTSAASQPSLVFMFRKLFLVDCTCAEADEWSQKQQTLGSGCKEGEIWGIIAPQGVTWLQFTSTRGIALSPDFMRHAASCRQSFWPPFLEHAVR